MTSSVVVPTDKDKFAFLSIDITERIKLDGELKKHKEGLELLVQERTKKLEDALKVKISI